MRIRISALDTLFFRDGKPFDRGEETWADGIFPPPPSSFYGALRSLYFIKNPEHIDLAGKGEDTDPTTKLIINDIQLIVDNDLGLLCPADVVHIKDEDEVSLLKLRKQDGTFTNNVFKLYSLGSERNEEGFDKEVESLMSSDLLVSASVEDYLNGERPYVTTPISKKIITEPKVGIGRDNHTHISDEGKLYRVGMSRYKGEEGNQLQFEVNFELEGLKLEVGEKGFLKLGGEGKGMAYEVIEDIKMNPFKNTSRYFKIILKTPAIFKNGWYPSFVDRSDEFKGIWNGINLQLIAASVGKPKYIGGFDMKKKAPKPMTKVVGEGAVYFFKIIDDTFELNIQVPFSISDDRINEGFGLAYCASINEQLEI